MEQPTAEEIHVWRVRLDDPEIELRHLHETLTSDEQDRAARFYFDVHRRRFVVGRGILRRLIARYLELGAADVRFDYAEKGKPSLAVPKFKDFEFNVSHSGDLALFAFTLAAPIGVDVEIIRPLEDMKGIAGRFFSSSEYEMLQSVAPTERTEAFFNCWTRKEAYIKAEGQGFSIPLDSFSVSVQPSEPAKFMFLKSRYGDSEAWSLHHLRPEVDAVGAVAIPAVGRNVVLRSFQ